MSASADPVARPPARGHPWLGRILLGLSVLAITWFYSWTVTPNGARDFTGREDQSYYNLLVRGFLKGQLSLDVPPDPILAASPNPYDPAQRMGRGMHDATFYQGRFYIYFGVTPVVVLYLPFHALTGTFITDRCVVALFALIGYAFALATWRAVTRRHFPQLPLVVHLAAVWALGLANMVPPMLRRPAMWEVPISSAYAFFMATLFLVWQALVRPRAARWLAAASLTMGLGIGARPIYLLAAAVLLVPVVRQAVALGRSFWRAAEWRRLAAAAVLPIFAVGVGLAIYNYQRFDSIFEFGQKYQLSGANENAVVHFSPAYFWFNVKVYLFSLPGWSPYFPFLTVINVPPVPLGQLGVEDPYGIIPTIPWVNFALVSLLLLRRRDAVALWIGTAWLGLLLTIAIVFHFGGATGRYQVDFTPTLGLLAAFGVAGLVTAAGPAARRAWIVVAVLVAGWSAGVNVFLSMQHNRLFEANYPEVYAKVARRFNHVSHWLGKLDGHRDGPVELRVVFPKGQEGNVEPLVVTGHEFLSDYLYVHYLASGLIRFGLEHTSRGNWTGPATRIDPEAEHTVVVQMGSLHPPVEHPAYDGMSSEERDLRTRTVKVLLDGRTVLHAQVRCYDASDWQPSIGASGSNRPGFKRDFSGRILSWRRVPPLLSDFAPGKTGKLHLLLKLPPFTRARSEPLLSTGESGKGNLIYISYLDATHYQLGHDRWGSGGPVSPVIGYDPEVPIDLDIACPPLLGEGAPARLLITLNGSPLLDDTTPYYPSRPDQIYVGRNHIGASTAEPEFTGAIEIQERVPE